jgi:hypothetical protein
MLEIHIENVALLGLGVPQWIRRILRGNTVDQMKLIGEISIYLDRCCDPGNCEFARVGIDSSLLTVRY